jgi:hypothetical protein
MTTLDDLSKATIRLETGREHLKRIHRTLSDGTVKVRQAIGFKLRQVSPSVTARLDPTIRPLETWPTEAEIDSAIYEVESAILARESVLNGLSPAERRLVVVDA